MTYSSIIRSLDVSYLNNPKRVSTLLNMGVGVETPHSLLPSLLCFLFELIITIYLQLPQIMDAPLQSHSDCFPIAFIETTIHPHLQLKTQLTQLALPAITHIRISEQAEPKEGLESPDYCQLDSGLFIEIERNPHGIPIANLGYFEAIPSGWTKIEVSPKAKKKLNGTLAYLKWNSLEKCCYIDSLSVEPCLQKNKNLQVTQPSFNDKDQPCVDSIELGICRLNFTRKKFVKQDLEKINYFLTQNSEILFQREFPVITKEVINQLFPNGIQLLRKGSGYRFVNSIMTDQDFNRFFCNSIIFSEECSEEALSSLSSEHKIEGQKQIYHEKCFTLISEFSCTDSVNLCLEHIYHLYLSQERQEFLSLISGLGQIFTFDKATRKVQYADPKFNLTFKINESYPTVSNNAVYSVFKFLQISNIIWVLEAILTENKVCFVSDSNCIIGYSIEAFLSFIYPLKWVHVIIPFIHEENIEYSQAPMATIYGIPKKILPKVKAMTNDIVYVDLDENRIEYSKEVQKIALNENLRKELKNRLKKFQVFDKVDVRNYLQTPNNLSLFKTREVEDPDFDPIEIRNIFLEFMVFLLKDYKQFFIQSEEVTMAKSHNISKHYDFDKVKCLHKNDKFMQYFVETALFAVLIQTKFFSPQDKWVRTLDRAIRKVSKINKRIIQEESDNNQTEGEEEKEKEDSLMVPRGCLNLLSLMSKDSGDDKTPRSSPSPQSKKLRSSLNRKSVDSQNSKDSSSMDSRYSCKSQKQTSIGNRLSLDDVPNLKEPKVTIIYENEQENASQSGIAYHICKFISIPVLAAKKSIAAQWRQRKWKAMTKWAAKKKQKDENVDESKSMDKQNEKAERNMVKEEIQTGNPDLPAEQKETLGQESK